MSEFSVRCRELRKNLAITLKEMSEDLGIPLSSISKYEQGIIKPGVDILAKIAISLCRIWLMREQLSNNMQLYAASTLCSVMSLSRVSRIAMVCRLCLRASKYTWCT